MSLLSKKKYVLLFFCLKNHATKLRFFRQVCKHLRHEFHPGLKKESNRFRLRLKQIPGTYAKGLCYGIKTLERGFPPATDKLTDSLRRNT